MPDPVDNVAASSPATSAWANSVADAINETLAAIFDADVLEIPWAALTGVPLTFAPSAHTHVDAGTGGTIAYSALTGIPSTFTPATHSLASHSPSTPSSIGAWASGSAGGGSAGSKIWVGTTDPGGSASEGDVWIKG